MDDTNATDSTSWLSRFRSHRQRVKPRGLKWRSSVSYVTFVVGFGIATDLLVYSAIIPVVPFQLEKLGYSSPSALTAWLLFAYSIGIVISTPVITWLSERYNARRTPLLWGLLALAGFLVLFMEAPNYAVMVVARFVQGISSSVVWVVGLALLCDTVPEHKTGQQLGLAMTGLTIGVLAAPPIGGVLYDHFGFRAPFISGIIFTALDFIGRLFVIERKNALKWGHDPAMAAISTSQACPTEQENLRIETSGLERIPPIEHTPAIEAGSSRVGDIKTVNGEKRTGDCDAPTPSADTLFLKKRRSSFEVLKFMAKSSRTLTALLVVFIYAVVYTGLEPTLPLRLQDIYGFSSTKVGLIFLSAALPTIFSSPLSGWIADRFGVEWISFACLILPIPWYILLIINGPLAFFIACLAISSFFISGIISPITAELALVTRLEEGVGYAHVYGAFNLAYGIGSTVGPITAGQVYAHAHRGWLIQCCYGAALLAISSVLTFLFTGERPLLRRFRHQWTKSSNTSAKTRV